MSVTHISKIKAKYFGRLLTRQIASGRLLGNVSVIYERVPPHTQLPTIYHRRTTELIYCLRGTVTACLGGRRHRLRGGSLVILPPGVRHRFETKDGACECLSLFFPSLMISKKADIHKESR